MRGENRRLVRDVGKQNHGHSRTKMAENVAHEPYIILLAIIIALPAPAELLQESSQVISIQKEEKEWDFWYKPL